MVSSTIQLPPLRPKSFSRLIASAKRLGIDPGVYAKQLLEDALDIQREAETSTFDQIMGPVRGGVDNLDDAEIVKIVDIARGKKPARPKKKR